VIFILNTTFYEEDLNRGNKLHYLGFLSNLAWKAPEVFSAQFRASKEDVCEELSLLINWKDILH